MKKHTFQAFVLCLAILFFSDIPSNAQEIEKKRIAGDLHEGIAQTLSAAKAHVEDACLRIEQCASSEDATPLKIIIYRIVQEALTSIGKNGQADRMRLDLSKIDSNVILTIEDNAMAYHPVGTFPQEDSTREIGLATMKERTVLSGGTFSVDSNHRGGTISRASWPC